jgi:single-strand DNA-binding protein
MSFNKVILVGNLGRDPELRYTPQGTPVCNFSVATTERRKDREGEQQETTTWFKITMFGRQAENASQYLVKGSSVYLEGRLKLSEWTDKEGKTRTTLEVTGTEMQFLGGGNRNEDLPSHAGPPRESKGKPSHSGRETNRTGPEEPSDDEIPF